jgi:hypothetical protein
MVSFIPFMATENIYFQGLITACLNTLLLYGVVSLIWTSSDLIGQLPVFKK